MMDTTGRHTRRLWIDPDDINELLVGLVDAGDQKAADGGGKQEEVPVLSAGDFLVRDDEGAPAACPEPVSVISPDVQSRLNERLARIRRMAAESGAIAGMPVGGSADVGGETESKAGARNKPQYDLGPGPVRLAGVAEGFSREQEVGLSSAAQEESGCSLPSSPSSPAPTAGNSPQEEKIDAAGSLESGSDFGGVGGGWVSSQVEPPRASRIGSRDRFGEPANEVGQEVVSQPQEGEVVKGVSSLYGGTGGVRSPSAGESFAQSEAGQVAAEFRPSQSPLWEKFGELARWIESEFGVDRFVLADEHGEPIEMRGIERGRFSVGGDLAVLLQRARQAIGSSETGIHLATAVGEGEYLCVVNCPSPDFPLCIGLLTRQRIPFRSMLAIGSALEKILS